ncbi:hypothetical protein [Chelatococcus asaccharovorans]|uniref:Uncharacterized protein n=1 Tax=Chelatococcus asaccharovorans TaxID=28210 RepID=A0A2V3U0Q7_9HYPH|nr:hypothetical protein [Chelatococcus asaccharovorans]MBS7704339.1 hypothetical protein [Chelatococcus asaccharovorans]PXW55783.1 hypothetical protein C7450_109193 [Chelatococcus asaccharovorans]
MLKRKRPQFVNTNLNLKLDFGHRHKEAKGQFEADDVNMVHGSNSASLEGLVRFRALLPMQLIYQTGWFHKRGLGSGERGYVFEALFQKPTGQPWFPRREDYEWQRNGDGRWSISVFPVMRDSAGYIATGVSLSYADRYSESIHYAEIGSSKEADIFPILYGVRLMEDDLIRLAEHPVSKAAISIQDMMAIYVPDGKREVVRAKLEDWGLTRLSRVVKVGKCFTPDRD